MSTAGYQVLWGVLILLVLQCLISIWNWSLAFRGREGRRENARIKSSNALIRARLEEKKRAFRAKLERLAAMENKHRRLRRTLRHLESRASILGGIHWHKRSVGTKANRKTAVARKRPKSRRERERANVRASATPRIRQHRRARRAEPEDCSAASLGNTDVRMPAKLGVVLSGGGGKGAYQVGVLRVLRAAGLRPDAIAGTSVGAINATLLCLDDLEVAADFWRQVSFWQVAKVGVMNIVAAPLLVFALITAGSSDDIDAGMRKRILLKYYAKLVPVNVMSLLLGAPPLAVLGIVVGCVGLITLGYLANPLIGRLGLALLNNAPLARQIEEKVRPERILAAPTPLFVTVAARRSMVDPDRPHWLDANRQVLVARQPYVPEYRQLQRETLENIHRFILQSAAIPFGVFPLRRIGDSGWVDGGVADNVPIQPLIDTGCTRIIVVHLNCEAKADGWRLTDPDELWARLGSLRELRRLAALNRDRTYESLVHEVRLREAWSDDERHEAVSAHVAQDYGRANVEVVHVVPSQSLGSFVSGTMNFSANTARRLIELGEEDARRLLKASAQLSKWLSTH